MSCARQAAWVYRVVLVGRLGTWSIQQMHALTFSISGNCMNLEELLGEVETDRRWLHGDSFVFTFDRREFRSFPRRGSGRRPHHQF
jgi:hypothetical protein